ncbi:MAG: L-seryl-tRNA(Sec) selenium transferase, partial [Gammaproteobacteria bacterium]|nr:L-seryl-tRNA(Sec) selenium transferase [Gammaproteobacteria bacterium]
RSLGAGYEVTDVPLFSQIGSGALPVEQLPSHGLAVRALRGRGGSVVRLEAALRELPRPVIGRLAERALWLDVRCLESAEEPELFAQLAALRP